VSQVRRLGQVMRLDDPVVDRERGHSRRDAHAHPLTRTIH
jgi:hypothetical protein